MNTNVKENRGSAFVSFIIERIKKDKGIAAALRRADNPATEYQCWEQLAAFNVELDKAYIRLPYATVAAAIAKAKVDANGSVGIGRALASCYDDGSDSDQAKAKLRRILACDSVEEVCRILRPVFSLIESRGKQQLDFAQLLDGLLKFYWDDSRQQVKSRWAQDFYSRQMQAASDVVKIEGVA